jgi:hypothetical protein
MADLFVARRKSNLDAFDGLNFCVIGGTVEPENPSENTIWVNTDVAITNLSSMNVSSNKPSSPLEGEVWIGTADNSPIKMNILKNGNIILCPVIAYQYVNETWNKLDAKIYQNGVWTTLWDGTLYSYGDQYVAVTGGWGLANISSSHTAGTTGAFNTDHIYATNVTGGSYGAYMKNAIDLTKYTTLHVTCTGGTFRMAVAKDMPYPLASFAKTTIMSAGTDRTMDISTLSGLYKIGVSNESSGSNFYKIWLT